MALEKLQSVFNNIEDNTQSLEDGYPVESISNSLYDDFHSFGTQGNRTELIEITKISKKQSPSPLMAINGISNAEGTITPIDPVNGHNFKQIRINDNAGTNLLKTVNNEHGFGEVVSSVPNVSSISLGQGDFVFGSLFAHNHSDSIKRPINDSLPGTLKSDLLLYVSPKNDQNLNIKAHDTLSRRGAFGLVNEPYITHNIPKSGDKLKLGYNRDGFPERAEKEDILRLAAYHTSPKGLLKLVAENVTNISIGDGITLAEPFGGLLLPAFPIPMTGFLNDYQQAKQGRFQGIQFPDKLKAALKQGIGGKGFELKDIPGSNTVSIRKPGVKEYSKMFRKLTARPFIAANQGDTDPFFNSTFTNPIKLQEYQDKEAKKIKHKFEKKQARLGRDTETGQPGMIPLTKTDRAKNVGAAIGNGVIAGINGASAIVNAVHNAARKAVHAAKEAAKEKFDEIAQAGVTLPKQPLADFSGLARHGDGKYKVIDNLSMVPPMDSADGADVEENIDPGDFYVRIHDARRIPGNPNGRLLYFRGFVTGITENVTPSWNPTQYIGRSEDVWIYQKGERDLSFNLRVAPANKTELEYMYQKMDVLTSLAYPHYLPDRGLKMSPPFTYLYMGHIGSKAVGQFGYIKSMTYTVNEQGDWDALTQSPRVFDIALSYQMLHKSPPNALTKFYQLIPSDVQDPA